jgi:hypothetical protein
MNPLVKEYIHTAWPILALFATCILWLIVDFIRDRRR